MEGRYLRLNGTEIRWTKSRSHMFHVNNLWSPCSIKQQLHYIYGRDSQAVVVFPNIIADLTNCYSRHLVFVLRLVPSEQRSAHSVLTSTLLHRGKPASSIRVQRKIRHQRPSNGHDYDKGLTALSRTHYDTRRFFLSPNHSQLYTMTQALGSLTQHLLSWTQEHPYLGFLSSAVLSIFVLGALQAILLRPFFAYLASKPEGSCWWCGRHDPTLFYSASSKSD